MPLADRTRYLLYAVLQLIEIIIAIFLRESPAPPNLELLKRMLHVRLSACLGG